MRLIFDQSDPEIAKNIIEIIKALLFTLSGYLFGKKKKITIKCK